MASKFSKAEWTKITNLFESSADLFGLPKRRSDSVVIGTFNIRKLGPVKKRSAQSWQLLARTVKRFDLIAVQEVMDDLSGLEHLLSLLGKDYGMAVSDVTGVKPGERGNPERLGFLYNWKRIERTAIASDITYDRSEIVRNLYENRKKFSAAWNKHTKALEKWEAKKAAGKRPAKPPIQLPRFLTFIRQPHYVSFRVKASGNAKPYEFMVVNTHLLYGKRKEERKWEFFALIDWLTVRAKQADKLYHPNLLLLGDCNLDFKEETSDIRDDIDLHIKDLNQAKLRSKKAAKANFPLLSEHPDKGFIRTNLRGGHTYDQIGIFAHDKRLPDSSKNAKAGTVAGGFDYGVFRIGDLIANALHGNNIDTVNASQRKAIFKKAEHDISDHLPAWMRLKKPK